MVDRANLRASLWSALYCLLVVLVCGALVEGGVSLLVTVPVGLFVLPLLASVPFLFWLRPKTGARES